MNYNNFNGLNPQIFPRSGTNKNSKSNYPPPEREIPKILNEAKNRTVSIKEIISHEHTYNKHFDNFRAHRLLPFIVHIVSLIGLIFVNKLWLSICIVSLDIVLDIVYLSLWVPLMRDLDFLRHEVPPASEIISNVITTTTGTMSFQDYARKVTLKRALKNILILISSCLLIFLAGCLTTELVLATILAGWNFIIGIFICLRNINSGHVTEALLKVAACSNPCDPQLKNFIFNSKLKLSHTRCKECGSETFFYCGTVEDRCETTKTYETKRIDIYAPSQPGSISKNHLGYLEEKVPTTKSELVSSVKWDANHCINCGHTVIEEYEISGSDVFSIRPKAWIHKKNITHRYVNIPFK